MKGVMFFLLCFLLVSVSATSENLSIAEQNTSLQRNETAPSNSSSVSFFPVRSVSLVRITPDSFTQGDAQFTLVLRNNGTEALYSLVPVLAGTGFASYEITPLERLEVNGTGYILVRGLFQQAGNVTLSIRIGEQIFSLSVFIRSLTSLALPVSPLDLTNLTERLTSLKRTYESLEALRTTKANQGYDVSDIHLDEAKKLLREAESSLLLKEGEQALVKLTLAQEELIQQDGKLAVVQPTSLSAQLKENAVLFSTLAGALLTFFTLYELLKKKSVGAVESVKQTLVKKE